MPQKRKREETGPPWAGCQEKIARGFMDRNFPPETNNPLWMYWDTYARTDFHKQTRYLESKCFNCYNDVERGSMIVCTFPDCNKVYHPQCVDDKTIPRKTIGGNYVYFCKRHFCCMCHRAENSSTHTLMFKCSLCSSAYCNKCIRDVDRFAFVGEESYCEDCMIKAEKEGRLNYLFDLKSF